jgi:hypothetical protein
MGVQRLNGDTTLYDLDDDRYVSEKINESIPTIATKLLKKKKSILYKG